MAQENRHLTTEQLSTYLDEEQLPSVGAPLAVGARFTSPLDAHLKTCEQCQQELTDLRQTVALLHALPRPALPRSFVLPLDIQFASDPIDDEIAAEAEETELAPAALAAASSPVPLMRTVRGTRRWPTYVRTALRTVSAIAAVIGLALFLSGALVSFQGGGQTATTSSTMSQATNGNTQNANVASSKSENSSGGAAKPQISPSSRATITPPASTPAAEATPITAVRGAGTPVVGQKTFSAAPTASQSPTILFFDLSTGPGRLGFGFLLLLLGIMGYVVFQRRWRQERA